jgi:hypothetical protein
MSLKENAPEVQVDLSLTASGLWKRSEVTASKSTPVVQTFLCFEGGAELLPFSLFFFLLVLLYKSRMMSTKPGERPLMIAA